MSTINSIIGEGTSLKGEISSLTSLQIAGEVIGSINVKGEVFVVGKGRVLGDINGGRVVVSGTVDGNIIASKGLEILKTGKVNGEITCDKLIIEEGSTYQGKVNVSSASELEAKATVKIEAVETIDQDILEIKDV